MSTSSPSTWSSNYSVIRSSRARGRTESGRTESGVYCDCGIESPCREAWKTGTVDLGRRFYGCSRWRDTRLRCGFFEWADPPYTERAREVIEMLREKAAKKEDEVMVLRNELDRVKRRNVIEEDDNGLAELKEEMERMNRRLKIMTMICALLVFIVGIVVVI